MPYGEYPAGKATVTIEDDGKDSTSNGVEAKWKKNYVPYEEEKNGERKE